jgi:hypothetical protein
MFPAFAASSFAISNSFFNIAGSVSLPRMMRPAPELRGATHMPVAARDAAPESRLFNVFYCAIFHIPLGNLAQFAIASAGQIIQFVLWGLDLLAILSGIWLALSRKREERKAKQ